MAGFFFQNLFNHVHFKLYVVTLLTVHSSLYDGLCTFLLVALQKTPSLLGAECRGVGTTPLHANERGQTVRFVAVIEPPVYWGISIK